MPNLPPFSHLPCLTGYTEKGKSIANVKFEMKHVKKHVKYLKSMTKRWYCILLKILTYLLSARFWLCLWLCLWLWRCRCRCRFAVRSFVCLLCNAAMRLVGGSAREGGSSKNCMRQRAASNSYDYHNLYGLGDLRQAAAAAALGRARNQNQNKSKGKRNWKQKTERATAKARARESRRNLLRCWWRLPCRFVLF